MRTRLVSAVLGLVLALAARMAWAQPLTTAFTYQGRLDANGAPATGTYDFRFTLFDAPSSGNQLGPILCMDNLTVANGIFTVQLDFGSQFAGLQRYLEIWVRPDTGLDCSTNANFTTLSPRQDIIAAPNAVYSLAAASAGTAATATNATQLNSQPAAFYLNAGNLNAGTVPDARLSSNVGTINTVQTVAATKNFFAPPAFTAASGAPFTITAATGLVTNLNSDMLNGLHSADYVQINGAQTIGGQKNFSIAPAFTAASGAPFTVASNGLVTNLNADLLDGLNVSSLVQTTGAQTISGSKTFTSNTYINGFLGLGTTTGIGAANFVLSQNTTSYGGMYINTSGAGEPFYGYSQAGNIVSLTYVDGADANKWKLFHSGGNRFAVTTAGDFGIGTVSPSGRLTVSEEADTSCFLDINSGSTVTQSSNLRFADRGTAFWTVTKNSLNDLTFVEVAPNANRLYLAHGGNVGIGSSASTPTAQLDVTTTAPSFEAIVGYAQGSGSLGIWGDVTAASSTAVYGYAESATGTNYGVVGRCTSPTGYAVYCEGAFSATGTKSFQIDHPLDPENKYLNHYCEEGPEPLNVYRGTVTLDQRGEASIDLPAYFSEINKDPSYTLTAVGSPMPALYVSREIVDNRFEISGGAPGGKVCWRVEATRNDRFVRTYGAPVEQDKPAESRGKYLRPALYNQPPEKGQFYRPNLHAAPADDSR
jgi:hypothetical protein